MKQSVTIDHFQNLFAVASRAVTPILYPKTLFNWHLLFSLLLILVFGKATFAADLQMSATVSKTRIAIQDEITLTITMKGLSVERLKFADPFPASFSLVEKIDKPNLSQDAFGRPVSGRIIRYKLRAIAGGKFRVGAISVDYFGETRRLTGEMVEVTGGPREKAPPKETKLPKEPVTGDNNSTPAMTLYNGPLDVRLNAEVDRDKVYVGEKITLSVRITHNANTIKDIKPVEFAQFTNFWNKEMVLTAKENPSRELMMKGHAYATQYIHRFILYPTRSGKLTIPALKYSMLAYPSANNPVRQLVINTAPIDINVSALPTEGQPGEFRGAVGECKVTTKLEAKTTRVGVPIRLLLEVETKGNAEALTPPPLPQVAGMKFYEPNRLPTKDDAPNLASWEIQVVPTTSGNLTLPPLTFTYFNPQTVKYQTVQSSALTFAVDAAPATEISTLTPGNRGNHSKDGSLWQNPILRYGIGMLLLVMVGFIALKFIKRPQALTDKATKSNDVVLNTKPVTVPKATEPSPESAFNPLINKRPEPEIAAKVEPKPVPVKSVPIKLEPAKAEPIKPTPTKPSTTKAEKANLTNQTPMPTTFTGEVTRIVNASYGKLHRGDERTYCAELLRAMRMIFEKGLQLPASELNSEKLAQALQHRLPDSLHKRILELYQECEQISFSPSANVYQSDRDKDYARFQAARDLISELLSNSQK